MKYAFEVADELVRKMTREFGVMQNIEYVFQNGDMWIAGYPHSHIGKYTLKLENVTKEELDLAIKFLFKNKLVTKTDTVYDYYNNPVNTTQSQITLKSKGLERGLAVEVKNGRVQITCDKYGYGHKLNEFTTILNDTVKAVRMNQSLRKMRYNTQMKYSHDEKAVILVGVQY